jgi:hypothetical protein
VAAAAWASLLRGTWVVLGIFGGALVLMFALLANMWMLNEASAKPKRAAFRAFYVLAAIALLVITVQFVRLFLMPELGGGG